MIRNRVFYLIALILTAVFFILSDQWFALALFGVLIIVPIIFAVIERAAIRGFDLTFVPPQTCTAESSTVIKINISRRSTLPPGPVILTVRFHNRLYNMEKTERWKLVSGENSVECFEKDFKSMDCGMITLTADLAVCCDMLGLFSYKRKVQICQDIVVFPKKTDLTVEVHDVFSQYSGELYDAYKRGADVTETAFLREYIPGDPLQRIHWKLSEKVEQTIVKEFSHSLDHHTLLLFDLKKDFVSGRMIYRSSNYVLAFIASLSDALLGKGYHHDVGRLVNGELQLQPVDGQNAYDRMMHIFLSAPAPGRRVDISAAQILAKEKEGRFSRILYVTNSFERDTVQSISNLAALTVIYLSDTLQDMADDSVKVVRFGINTFDRKKYLEI